MPKALFLDKLFFYHVVPVKPYLLVNLPVNRWSGKIQKLKALPATQPRKGSQRREELFRGSLHWISSTT